VYAKLAPKYFQLFPGESFAEPAIVKGKSKPVFLKERNRLIMMAGQPPHFLSKALALLASHQDDCTA
jgi:hypothetical protein